MPNRHLTPALSVGVDIQIMASTFPGFSFIPSGVTIFPRYLTSFMHNCNLSKLSFYSPLQNLLQYFVMFLHILCSNDEIISHYMEIWNVCKGSFIFVRNISLADLKTKLFMLETIATYHTNQVLSQSMHAEKTELAM